MPEALVLIVLAGAILVLGKRSKNLKAQRDQALAAGRRVGPMKVTLIAVGGVLAVVIPPQLTAHDALHERARLQQAVNEALATDRLQQSPLSNEDLETLSRQRAATPSGVSEAEAERVREALESAGYQVAITSDHEEVEAAYDELDPMAESLDVDEDDPSGIGFRGILIRDEQTPGVPARKAATIPLR